MCLNKLPNKNGVLSHEGQILKGSTYLQWLCLEGLVPHRFSALLEKCDEWSSCLKAARKLGEVRAILKATASALAPPPAGFDKANLEEELQLALSGEARYRCSIKPCKPVCR